MRKLNSSAASKIWALRVFEFVIKAEKCNKHLKMQNWRQKGREGSVWNLFQNKANINNDLKDILDEVVAVRKVCMSSRASMLDMLQIKESLMNIHINYFHYEEGD